MSKIFPFGGYQAKEYSLDADPAPLLAEIAACAYAGEPLPPALAEWFYKVHQAGRVNVSLRSGAKRKDEIDLLLAAARRIDELTSVSKPRSADDADGSAKKVTQAAAIKAVQQEFGLSSSATTIKKLLSALRESQLEMKVESRLSGQSGFIARFRKLKRRGITGKRALTNAWLFSLRDLPYRPSVDELREWQELADTDYTF